MDLAGINFSNLGPSNKLINIKNQESLRGYHEYHSVWTSKISEQLVMKQKSHNAFDIYAIAATKLLPATIRSYVVRHLPPEISRFAHYLIIHKGRVSCNVADAHDQRSPLVQRGLEIPIWVTVAVELGRNNAQVIKRYEELVNEH